MALPVLDLLKDVQSSLEWQLSLIYFVAQPNSFWQEGEVIKFFLEYLL